ncbi:MAG TPA: 4-hydroxy-tetrahydrodipicolinate reductase [Acidimicrobiales bacterium]|jgi:4-hydroxy-tetrahydrodipicolinate reductase|nr:4-hydroxy-tetrahydrodipicolinate reductase [Acidimicrobiales bacterium]
MAIRVGVFGAGGRMGLTVCSAVAGDPGLELAAAIDPAHTGEAVEGVTIVGDPTSVGEQVDVVIDFTRVDAARGNVRWAAEHGVHAVVGTTGITADDHELFRAAFTRSNCVIAPNFAIGAVLMIAFAERAAPFFETAEIVELHHDAKRDAPSGTAMLTAERMAAASGDWAADPTEELVLEGSRGAEGPAGIHVHALRVRGMVASQEVILGTTGQSLTIRHDTYDRSSFMPGVILAAKAVANKPGLTIGLDRLLDL